MSEEAKEGMNECSLVGHSDGEDRSAKTEPVRNTCWRTKLALLLSIERIMLLGRGNGRMLTLTFRENVIDLSEAWEAWQAVRLRMLKTWPGMLGAGVWERQKRGAWHLHLAIERRLEAGAVRELVGPFGFGRVHLRWMRGSPKGLAWYLIGYLGDAVRPEDRSRRLVVYVDRESHALRGPVCCLQKRFLEWRCHIYRATGFGWGDERCVEIAYVPGRVHQQEFLALLARWHFKVRITSLDHRPKGVFRGPNLSEVLQQQLPGIPVKGHYGEC
jgi:hypothetical protein